MFDFTGKNALITGASGNLGEATARYFQAAGAGLILVGSRLASLEETFPDLAGRDRVWFFGADLTDEAAVADLAKDVLAQARSVDFLVNIAGGYRAGEVVHETSFKTWEFMLALNARTVFLTSRAFLPHMVERGGGKIVTIGASASVKGTARNGAYAASKAAVLRLTESLSAEVKKHGINVNCVLPGTIDTPDNREAMPKANFERWVDPADLAAVIAFLCSDGGRAIHGAGVPVYGLD